MSPILRHGATIVALLVTLAVVIGPRVAGAGTSAAAVTPAQDRGTFTFAPGTHPVDERTVLDAVAAARPEARRLIDDVDGLVTIRVGVPDRAGAAGLARYLPDGSYELTLDLGPVSRSLGTRGVMRLVLHELGHVVDDRLVATDMAARLDAAIPAGYPCGTAGDDASCVGRSAREERFAETFAKWAMGDIGVNLNIGYKVPPPSASLETWGAPLAALAVQPPA